VRPTTSDQYLRPAARPQYSVLGHQGWAAAGLTPMSAWDEMLPQALARPGFAALLPTR